MNSYEDFKFSMPLTKESESFLKKKGYEKRSGTCAYPENRKVFMVVPFKKWYWEGTCPANVHLEEKTKTITVVELKVTVGE